MHLFLRFALVAALATYARQTRKLTVLGSLTAFGVGIVHCVPPSTLHLSLLATFFLIGSAATRIKAAKKREIVHELDASGDDTWFDAKDADTANQGRTAIQVLCNASVPTIWIIAADIFHFWWGPHGQRAILRAIVAHYAAMTADTLSSELGILSPGSPRLVTNLSLRVPRGTNGGISVGGIVAGALGSCVVGYVCAIYGVTPFIAVFWGIVGTLLDSLLGATLQSSVADGDGKIYESSGGFVRQQGKLVSGRNILTNNQVNLVTSVLVSVLAFIL